MDQSSILPKPPSEGTQGDAALLAVLARAAQAECSTATQGTEWTEQADMALDPATGGGWLPFDRFMALALYTPGLGYYAGERPKFGWAPPSPAAPQGSDFVTAPELSPLFGAALAVQVADALAAGACDEVWEFGAGSGALALQLIPALAAQGVPLRRYTIVELSASLRARQRQALAGLIDAGTVEIVWVDGLPEQLVGVVIGNEVLDAMPVKLLHRQQGVWKERGVRVSCGAAGAVELAWQDRPSPWRPPLEPEGPHDYLTEIHPQAEAFVRTLADRLTRGVVLLIDYGFPEAEYYHPQRSQGTLMCHQHHRADDNPLQDVGDKDITAHVNFTGIALAAQDAGLEVLGYTSQARFLINCGLAELLAKADLGQRAMGQRLLHEHEMGELFKVLALGKALASGWLPLGFAVGDRSHRL